MKLTKKFINQLVANPIKVLDELSDDDIANILQKANYEYYNSDKPLFSDVMFDMVKEYMEKRNPKHPILKNIGAAVDDKAKKVVLPYFLASLDKIKTDENVLEKWTHKYDGQCIISDKLDGVSGLLIWKNNKMSLYTRGDGEVGQDISHLLPFIRNIPSLKDDEIAVRGEIIISKVDFKKIEDKAANARNIVSGLVNAKVPDLEIASLTQFVAYELIVPQILPSKQFDYMDKLGFKIAFNKTIIHKDINVENLSKVLMERRSHSPFEVDGIVVMHDKIYKRIKENPSWGFAFKSIHTLETAEVLVTNVEWNMSKDGYLKPVVNFPGVKLSGVLIKRATGFNAKYIYDNKIGPGSIIIIIRSGDVIPYINKVLSPSEVGEAQMPNMPYVWNKTNVDIMLPHGEHKENDEIRFKNLEHFFNKINVKGLSSGILKKLYDSGFKSVKSIFDATVDELLKVPTIKDKTANNLVDAIKERRKTLDCMTIMNASNSFGRGFGSKKLELVVGSFPNAINKREPPTIDQLIGLKGIEKTSAEQFLSNLAVFWEFLDINGLKCEVGKEAVVNDQVGDERLKGSKIVFTGFRDAELEKTIKTRGGEVGSGVTKTTTLLIKKDTEIDSGKIKKAKELGIKIMNLSDFLKDFINTTTSNKKVNEVVQEKVCPEGKVLNPLTRRCVKVKVVLKKKEV